MYYYKILNQPKFLLIKINCTHNHLLFKYKILLLQIYLSIANKSNNPSKNVEYGTISSKFESVLFDSVISDVNSATIKSAYTSKELFQIAKTSIPSLDVLR